MGLDWPVLLRVSICVGQVFSVRVWSSREGAPVATRDVFSADELAQLRGFPEIGRAELIRYFMLTPADEQFVRRFRDKRNVLGAAVQLCTLPWLGFVPEDVPSAPAAAVARLSDRHPGPAARDQGPQGSRRRAGQLRARPVGRVPGKGLVMFLAAPSRHKEFRGNFG